MTTTMHHQYGMQPFQDAHLQHPPRKPLSGFVAPQAQAPPRQPFPERQQSLSHSRSRTSSSTVLPPLSSFTNQPSPTTAQFGSQQRRPSNATTSTSNSGTYGAPSRNTSNVSNVSNVSASVRRSTSSRSSGSPTSYVALMRKQKATVWCDRSQPEDPQTLARQKAAKTRATLEVHGGGQGTARTSTLGGGSMVGKIRHHGVPRAPGYNPATLAGAGVPMRLSANEVGDKEEDREDTDSSLGRGRHHRSGSGRSSMGSGRFPSGYQRPQGRFSQSSTPPNDERSPDHIPELAETPVPGKTQKEANDYFASKGNHGNDDNSGDLEDSFGTITDMAAPNAAATQEKERKKAEELRRRGSVDDRSMTMSGVRLFVANPDLMD